MWCVGVYKSEDVNVYRRGATAIRASRSKSGHHANSGKRNTIQPGHVKRNKNFNGKQTHKG